ncbi:hypothetical protein AFLA_012521 [Aspergillus flavus NRRL3357]|nr:hypothetical protein AFLA_012521 [Aspergillus flavus NRRL3357]
MAGGSRPPPPTEGNPEPPQAPEPPPPEYCEFILCRRCSTWVVQARAALKQ